MENLKKRTVVNLGMTKSSTLFEVQKLFDMYFQANSMLDNIVYALDVDFNMSKFSDFVHIQISHKMPLLADNLNDFGRLRGDRFHRGALLANDRQYMSPLEALQDIDNYFAQIEEQIGRAIDVAINDRMKMWEDFLRTFEVDEQAKYTHQIKKFIRGMQDYSEDGILSSFAKDFGAYITLSGDTVD